MLTLLFALSLGILPPVIVFSEKDKRAPGRFYTLSRLAFAGWFVGCLILSSIGGAIGNALDGAPVEIASAAWALSMIYVSTRRLADMGVSQWWSLLGLLWPLSLLWHLALCFIPGRSRNNDLATA